MQIPHSNHTTLDTPVLSVAAIPIPIPEITLHYVRKLFIVA